MKSITIAQRKINKETYTFILNVPEYKGEKGVLGIELEPYIIVETPENSFEYSDTFFYNYEQNNGHFAYRYHPEWIKRKIIEFCNRFYNAEVGKYELA